jgi:hypothetical protein
MISSGAGSMSSLWLQSPRALEPGNATLLCLTLNKAARKRGGGASCCVSPGHCPLSPTAWVPGRPLLLKPLFLRCRSPGPKSFSSDSGVQAPASSPDPGNQDPTSIPRPRGPGPASIPRPRGPAPASSPRPRGPGPNFPPQTQGTRPQPPPQTQGSEPSPSL